MNKNTTWQMVVIACVAIMCIAAIEIYALSQGIDGTILAGSMALIGGIAGGVGVKVLKK